MSGPLATTSPGGQRLAASWSSPDHWSRTLVPDHWRPRRCGPSPARRHARRVVDTSCAPGRTPTSRPWPPCSARIPTLSMPPRRYVVGHGHVADFFATVPAAAARPDPPRRHAGQQPSGPDRLPARRQRGRLPWLRGHGDALADDQVATMAAPDPRLFRCSGSGHPLTRPTVAGPAGPAGSGQAPPALAEAHHDRTGRDQPPAQAPAARRWSVPRRQPPARDSRWPRRPRRRRRRAGVVGDQAGAKSARTPRSRPSQVTRCLRVHHVISGPRSSPHNGLAVSPATTGITSATGATWLVQQARRSMC